jgi:hypothetical protein
MQILFRFCRVERKSISITNDATVLCDYMEVYVLCIHTHMYLYMCDYMKVYVLCIHTHMYLYADYVCWSVEKERESIFILSHNADIENKHYHSRALENSYVCVYAHIYKCILTVRCLSCDTHDSDMENRREYS